MSANLVSIIVPTYNYAIYLKEALDSIKVQTYENWECIIVDDGSLDDTSQVVKPYLEDGRFNYIKQDNQGTSVAKNTGLHHAQGSYIQFLDADDVLTPDKIQIHANYLELHQDVDLVYGLSKYFENNNRAKLWNSLLLNDIEWMPKVTGKGEELINILLVNNIMTISAPMFRRKCIDSVGNFKPIFSHHEDYELWLRFAFHDFKFQFIADANAMSLIRIHKSSASQSNYLMMFSMYKMYKDLYAHYHNHSCSRNIIFRILELQEIFMGMLIIGKDILKKVKQYLSAREYLVLKYSNFIPKKWRKKWVKHIFNLEVKANYSN